MRTYPHPKPRVQLQSLFFIFRGRLGEGSSSLYDVQTPFAIALPLSLSLSLSHQTRGLEASSSFPLLLNAAARSSAAPVRGPCCLPPILPSFLEGWIC